MKLPTLVVTRFAATIKGEMPFESQKVIDHDNSSDRKWLATHCFWAMRNLRAVSVMPIQLETVGSFPNIEPLRSDSF